jgi:hypothetical protein
LVKKWRTPDLPGFSSFNYVLFREACQPVLFAPASQQVSPSRPTEIADALLCLSPTEFSARPDIMVSTPDSSNLLFDP